MARMRRRWGPVNRIVTGLTPVFTVPAELLSGYSFWPDSFRPRAIKDRGAFLRTLSTKERKTLDTAVG